MSSNPTIPAQKQVSPLVMLRAMVGIGVMCALLIVLTFEGTKPRIQQLRAEALERAIFEVLPGITSTSTFVLQADGTIAPLGDKPAADKAQLLYAGYDDQDAFVGVAIEGSGQGYADVIRILYGYDPAAHQVVGFYVLETKETPGLGDKIEKDEDFLANFEALDISLNEGSTAVKNVVHTVKEGEKENPWEVEGISGATISSRAIGDIIGSSTSYWAPIIHDQQEVFER